MSKAATLVQVTAPHFCAGIEIVGGRCTEAAPILRWCIGKTEAELRAYFARKGWRAIRLRPHQSGSESSRS